MLHSSYSKMWFNDLASLTWSSLTTGRISRVNFTKYVRRWASSIGSQWHTIHRHQDKTNEQMAYSWAAFKNGDSRSTTSGMRTSLRVCLLATHDPSHQWHSVPCKVSWGTWLEQPRP